jgi:hypothetical protein
VALVHHAAVLYLSKRSETELASFVLHALAVLHVAVSLILLKSAIGVA